MSNPTPLQYTRYFASTGKGKALPARRPVVDRRDGEIYVYTPQIELAVNVALVTGRPLLIRGEPGAGKSSLAAAVARSLLWHFDTVRRLNDAVLQQRDVQSNVEYVQPCALWWAFDRESARTRGEKSP